jgi:hypothetical protein
LFVRIHVAELCRVKFHSELVGTMMCKIA